jgi:hypothetical protein
MLSITMKEWERDVHYPIFADIYYPEVGIIVSVGGFHKPSLPKLAGICVNLKQLQSPLGPNVYLLTPNL